MDDYAVRGASVVSPGQTVITWIGLAGMFLSGFLFGRLGRR